MNVVSLLTREGFRRACLRGSDESGGSAAEEKAADPATVAKLKADRIRKINNVPWLIVPIGAVIIPLVCYFFLRQSNTKGSADNADDEASGEYALSVVITGLAMFVELLSEPAYIQAQNLLLYKLRLQVEGVAVIARTLVTVALAIFFKMGLLAFAYGQLLYGLILLVGYWGHFFLPGAKPSASSLIPRFSFSILSSFDRSLVTLAFYYYWQGVQTIVLQDGEKLVLTLAGTVPNQGIYAIVNNLGSLVVRFIFQPIEEVSSSIFSKLLGDSINDNEKEMPKESDSTKIKEAKRAEARVFLTSAVKVVTYIGLYLASFGPGFSFIVLQILYAERYSLTEAPRVLAVYSFLVLLLAVNGVTEAFVYAVATKSELRMVNIRMIVFSVLYVSFAVLSIDVLGTTGLILANCFNMLLRIVVNGWFIRRYFEKDGGSVLAEALPKPRVLGLFTLVGLVSVLSSNFYCCEKFPKEFYSTTDHIFRVPGIGITFPRACFLHILVGMAGLFVVTAALYLWEREFLRNARNLLRRR